MEWDFVNPLESENLISEYEKVVGYNFPISFVNCVKLYNNGYPKKTVFISMGKRRHKRVFDHLFSFNKDDITTIWHRNDWHGRSSDWLKFSNGKVEKCVAFAGDVFGNLICFDKTNDHVVFIDHETFAIESVANSFSEFIAGLRVK